MGIRSDNITDRAYGALASAIGSRYPDKDKNARRPGSLRAETGGQGW